MSLAGDRIGLGGGRFSHEQIASTLSRRIQQLIILPTEKCNFRCTYCYEDFLIGKMREPVQQGIERLMEKRIPELSELSISWFGGEPLAARDVVLRLSSHASRLCREHGVTLHGGLTTNAYVLNFALFEELLSYDQRFFQITLDGWGDSHDVVRRLANGGGTFARIWGNLEATRQSRENFTILIRVHVRRDNFVSVETLVENIARTFGDDPRYQLDFEHLRDLGGEGGKSVERPLSRAELQDIEASFRALHASILASMATTGREATRRPAAPQPTLALGEGNSSSAPDAAPYICYAAKPNSLLIRADGRIGKCTVALTDERNTIGRVNPDGTLTIDNSRLRPWVRGLADLDDRTLECPLVGLPKLASVA